MKAALAALWGALCVIVAFPTLDLVLPVLLAWPPLLVAARRLTWRKRLLFGWLMGALYQLVLFRWVAFTLDVMTDLPAWAGGVATGLFAAWHGLMCGVFLALAEPARRAAEGRWRGTGPVAIAVTYVTIEWVWPFLFPWTLGHAFWQVGPLSSLMALTGAPGLSFVVPALGAAAAEAWVARRGALRAVVVAGVPSAALLVFGLAWFAHLDATPPRRTLRVAVVQPNYTLEDKRLMTPGTRNRLLLRFEDMLRGLPGGTYDLIVASEGAFPWFWDLAADRWEGPPDTDPPLNVFTTRFIQAALREGPGAHAIVGGLRIPPGERIRNAAVHFGPDGRLIDAYDKQILVPFGEYMPLRDLFPDLQDAVQGVSNFGSGERPCQFEVGPEQVACGICYESIFTDFIRDNAGDPDLLVNLTIDTWFGRSTAPWFHLMVQASRAAELGVPLVRSALTGISAVVGADGVPTHLLGLDEQGVIDAEVPLKDVTTPFRAVGPLFRWLCVALALALLGEALRRRRALFPPPPAPAVAVAEPETEAEAEPDIVAEAEPAPGTEAENEPEPELEPDGPPSRDEA